MKRYMLIKSSEDGNPISWLRQDQVEDIGQLMEDYSIERFLDAVPDNDDPNYWPEREALLLEVRILRVRPKEVVTSWEIE